MLSYTFDKDKKLPLYEQLYEFIRDDITAARLKPGERLPGKRPLAGHLGISVITVENAYGRLSEEGYIAAKPRKGFFVEELFFNEEFSKAAPPKPSPSKKNKPLEAQPSGVFADLNSSSTPACLIPLKAWSKISKNAGDYIASHTNSPVPTGGTLALRSAICAHLKSFRGIIADPRQVIVGAGSEYLYGLAVQLLGANVTFALEDPGYTKLSRIYALHGVKCVFTDSRDKEKKLSEELLISGASVAHVSPSHHFPTGRIMSVQKRYDLLAWAGGAPDRFIIEDDYDAEFRFNARPVPSLFGTDKNGRTIYINTFSKTITPELRISYMILPPSLVPVFYEKLGFLSSTVSLLNQYILARFLSEGHFEKHLNRARTYYRRIRDLLISEIRAADKKKKCSILEETSGLHFLLQIDTSKPDDKLARDLLKNGVNISALSSYYSTPGPDVDHIFLVKYQGLPEEKISETARRIIEGIYSS